ncbi:hypothetical protein [Arthrobacter zhaoguopingii]|uniref:hypothetical protein n=1 Tax=Arthrobacter zhaoguopingii TaxID=2681491 RepID=UPI001AEEE836|nr:hypothetical protein [Arthrobacter zhaoguopingii]
MHLITMMGEKMKRDSVWMRLLNGAVFGVLIGLMRHPDKHSNYRYERYVEELPEGAAPMTYEQWIEAYDAEWEARKNARSLDPGGK